MITDIKVGTALVERATKFLDNQQGEIEGGFGLHLDFAGWVDSGESYSSEELLDAVKAAKKEKESDPFLGPWTDDDQMIVYGNHLEHALRHGFELGYAFANSDQHEQKGLVN